MSSGIFLLARRDPTRCIHCGACEALVPCQGGTVGEETNCTGCGACAAACPESAIELVERAPPPEITITINGERIPIPSRITVLHALELLGHSAGRFPGEGDLFAPCRSGGCWSCAVAVDGRVVPSCVTVVREGMVVETVLPSGFRPLRLLHGWMGHGVGGVGTPWHLKQRRDYIEAAVFACGCNLRCPQCQNWTTTYCGKEEAYTPLEAAVLMTGLRRRCGVARMAISGGESTLNRPWLVGYVQELRERNPDPAARIHVDTNATLLTRDYIDELVEAGMTDIGPDLKGLHLETFMRITGISDRDLAERFLKTAWEAVRYLVNEYPDRLFTGVGIPYNRDLISLDEIRKMGDAIRNIDPDLQVCVLDYRPDFRRKDIKRPHPREMQEVLEILTGCGLSTVICQTRYGHIGPLRPFI